VPGKATIACFRSGVPDPYFVVIDALLQRGNRTFPALSKLTNHLERSEPKPANFDVIRFPASAVYPNPIPQQYGAL